MVIFMLHVFYHNGEKNKIAEEAKVGRHLSWLILSSWLEYNTQLI